MPMIQAMGGKAVLDECFKFPCRSLPRVTSCIAPEIGVIHSSNIYIQTVYDSIMVFEGHVSQKRKEKGEGGNIFKCRPLIAPAHWGAYTKAS